MNFNRLDEDVKTSLEKVKEVLSTLNTYKNKNFHSELSNLPIIGGIIDEYFRYKNSNGGISLQPVGDEFINE